MAASTRTSTVKSSTAFIGRNLRVSSTRSSIACISGDKLADLVEEQRAAVGLLEEAGVGLFAAGVGAGGVAEELGHDRAGIERGAVDRHHRPEAAAAGAVQAEGDQLLARAGFARDEDAAGVVGQARDLLAEPADGGAVADQGVVAAGRAEAEAGVVGLERPAVEQAAEAAGQAAGQHLAKPQLALAEGPVAAVGVKGA